MRAQVSYLRGGVASHTAGCCCAWLPSWAIHPECTALAVIFASPYWAELAIPSRDRRHRLFYQHLLLAVGDRRGSVRSIRNFDPLPDAIREQASWARLLSDPKWGAPILSREGPRKISFIDITDCEDSTMSLAQSPQDTRRLRDDGSVCDRALPR